MKQILIHWRSFKKWLLPRLGAPLARRAITLLIKTCKVEIKGIENIQPQRILVLWHNHLAPAAYFLRQFAPQHTYAPVISNSRDGEILTRFLRPYPQSQPIRVAHNAKYDALNAIINTLKNTNTIVVITPDGPRGPRHKAKPGAAIAAKEAGVPVVPMTWTADKYWTLNTWDKMMIPKPFSRILITVGPVLEAPTAETIENALIN